MVRPILASGGALAVHGFLRGDALSAIFAVQMLAGPGDADTHGEDDYRRWLSQAGYRSIEVQHLARRPESIVFASLTGPATASR